MNAQIPYIGLIDCNNFFVSCERIFDPSLRGRPCGVLSNNDGCFIARSNELKALGVGMGTPYFKVKDIIEKHNVIVRSANFSLYNDISKRVMSMLKKTFPRVEVYSVDEAFIYFGASSVKDIFNEGIDIKNKLNQWIGIPVSVGIAKTKTLAKVACHVAKEESEIKGVCLLESQEQVERVLKALDVADIWGIGRQKAKFLEARGVATAYDFLKLPEDWVKKHLAITGLRTLLELKGIPCVAFEDIAQNNKSILRSRSFSKPKTDMEAIMEAVAYHTTCAAELLRVQGSVTSSIGVFIRTSPHAVGPYYSQSGVEHLLEATDYTPDLLRAARVVLTQIFKPGYRYQKAGIYFPQVIPKAGSQLDLFKAHENVANKEKLMRVLDCINNKYGEKSLFYAAGGIGNTWQGKCKQASSKYTTDWDDLLVVE